MQTVLDNQTGQSIDFPDTTSADEIRSAVSNFVNGSIQESKPNFYDKYIKQPLQQSGASITDPLMTARAFTAGALDVGTFGAIHPTDAERQAFKEVSPMANVLGQFSGFLAPAKALSFAGAKAISMIPPLAKIAEGLTTVAESGNVAAAATKGAIETGGVMGAYTAIANPIQQQQEYGNINLGEVGKAVLKDVGMWSVAGGLTGYLAKPLSEIYTVPEAAQQLAKNMAVSAGSLYAIMKASGASDDDAKLGAGMAAVLHGLQFHGDMQDYRKAAIEQVNDLQRRYLLSQINAHDTVADRISVENTMNESQEVLDKEATNNFQNNKKSELMSAGYTDQEAQSMAETTVAMMQQTAKNQGISIEDAIAKMPTVVGNSNGNKPEGALVQDKVIETGDTVWLDGFGEKETEWKVVKRNDDGKFVIQSGDQFKTVPEAVIVRKPSDQERLFQKSSQQETKGPRGWIELKPDEQARITLTSEKNASTYMHELAHFWLKDMHDFIKSGNSSEDWNTLKDWLKIKDEQKSLSVDQQETFARGFERYLREGKSPTPELQQAFDNFKTWLSNIYKNVRQLNAHISNDVRKVFDRILAEENNPINKVTKSREMTEKLVSNMTSKVAGVEPTKEENVSKEEKKPVQKEESQQQTEESSKLKSQKEQDETPSTEKEGSKSTEGIEKVSSSDGSIPQKKIKSSFSSEENNPSEKLYQEQDNKFVKKPILDLFKKGNVKETADEIRKRVVGAMDEQIVRINQWAESGKKAVKNPTEQEAMFWYAGAEGDVDKIKEFIDQMNNLTIDDLPDHVKDKEEGLKNIQEYYEETLKPQLEAATKLSEEAIKKLEEGSQYYDEAGKVAKELGTIRSIRESYQSNRIYEPEPPADFVKTGKRSVGTYTSHSKQRVYDTPFDAVLGDKRFATTNYFDALTLHNEELTYINTSRKMLNEMAENEMGQWGRKENIQPGWKQLGTLEKSFPIKDKNGEAVIGEDGNQIYSHSVFSTYEKLATGLEAITDPNNLRKVKELGALNKFNGFIKSFNVALSFFHHFQFIKQTLSSKNGEKILANFTENLVKKVDPFESPEFKENEQYGASVGLRTSARQANYDIMADLSKVEGNWLDKIKDKPGVKQAIELSDANNKLLFDYMQRYFKVMTFGERVADWMKKNPDATDQEILEGHRGIARAINNTYGGLNWEMLGVTKSQQAIMRLALFAPDWLTSAVLHTKDAALDWKTPAGQIARANIAKGVLVGTLATQLMNKVTTGQWTDKNKKGHQLEWQISPGVYVNFYGGATGELVKFLSNTIETGGIPGMVRYFQAKLSPLVRTGTMIATGKNYSGQDISAKPFAGDNPFVKSLNYVLNVATQVTPLPFAMQSLISYLSSDEETVLGTAAVLSGLGRYSTMSEDAKDKEARKELQDASDNNNQDKINELLDAGLITDKQVEEAQKNTELSPTMRQVKDMRMEKLLDFASSANEEQKSELVDYVEEKFQNAMERSSPNRAKNLQKLYDKYIDKQK